MSDKRLQILVITPVRHIDGVSEALSSVGRVTFREDPTPESLMSEIGAFQVLFTNPNKSKVFIGKSLIDAAHALRVIVTASTGTNHIDKSYAQSKGIKVLSLTHERETINRITSTAEHAWGLTLAALRQIPQSFDAVKREEWDYEPYVGRQLNALTVGVVGYGRLGHMYARFAKSFEAQVLVLDPHISGVDSSVRVCERDEVLERSDILSFHVHHTEETERMVNQSWFSRMKDDVLLVNTSRGEIMHDRDLITFLTQHPKAKYAADVITSEQAGPRANLLVRFAKESRQMILTPHIGGMTREAQHMAYMRAVLMLSDTLTQTGLAVEPAR